MRGEELEIEDKLKEAASWQPAHEMPLGLERRALERSRPPLRPIGLAKPTRFVSTALAAAACGLLVYWGGTPPKIEPNATPVPVQMTATKTKPTSPSPALTSRPPVRPTKLAHAAPRRKGKRAPTPSRSRPQKHPVLVETDDPIVVQSRVAVDEPVYAPAFYAQPSEDGKSVEFTPVVASLGDPDVIYTPEE